MYDLRFPKIKSFIPPIFKPKGLNSRIRATMMYRLLTTQSPSQLKANRLFSDEFESNNFTAWSGFYSYGTAVDPVTENVHPHHNTYNVKFNGTSGGSCCYFDLVTQYPIVYSRQYYKFEDMPASGETIDCNRLSAPSDPSDEQLTAYVYNDPVTGTNWGLRNGVIGVYTQYPESVASNPVADTWYCIEILRDVTNGKITLWVDGVLKLQVNVALQGNTRYIYGGIQVDSASAKLVYCDCVVISDAYIGSE